MNKKSMTKFVYIILAFSMIAMMGMFSIVFIYEIGDSYILENIYNATITVEQSLNVSAALQTHALDLRNEYSGISLPYDLFFLFMLISAIVSTITISLKAKKEPPLSFFGSLFIGMMGIMLIIFIMDQVQSWFFEQLFYALFSDITLNLPIMTYYFDNFGWISGLWFILLLFINQIDVKFNFRGRFEQ